MKKRIIIYIAGMLLLATQNVFATVIAYAITNETNSPQTVTCYGEESVWGGGSSSFGLNNVTLKVRG